jgi:hypothetical protein
MSGQARIAVCLAAQFIWEWESRREDECEGTEDV